MISNEIEQILDEIFNPEILDTAYSKQFDYVSPNLQELQEVAGLIANDGLEEDFQKFFNKHPNFLFRAIPSSGGRNIGYLVKPPICTFFTADYAILTIGQGGCGITLIELERPSDKLFTSKLTPAKKLQGAIGQIDDWNEWLQHNQKTFINTSLELVRRAKKHPEIDESGSFKMDSNSKIDKGWNAFGGFENCYISNLIIIGRWANLSEKERKRLLYYNSKAKSNNYQIRTYDQLIRQGWDGPGMFW
ncbi:DUF4263 domain-containing protein [Mucilaginibacter dorajii]|uniref:Shedu protein SduA C-terminal domain-containing protein n=1 Tax=Mucilaginibacter dorajii TaxID=692994 RepID=A0ABP7Q197_9SPHI|nr:DUF4263 domain-containing protein [Mucilaginibacter dorajii]MCS3732860.1 hypothetical protein [Mucilaginibacter dorajii]